MYRKAVLTFAFAFAICLGGGIGAGAMYYKYRRDIAFCRDNALLCDVVDTLNAAKTTVNSDNPELSVINGYLSAYDKYSYIKVDEDADEYASAARVINNSFIAKGTGFEVEFDDDRQLYFSKVVEKSLAEKSGVQVGDVILSIDGDSMGDSALLYARKLNGRDDSVCSLIIERDGEKIDIFMTRLNAVPNENELDYKFKLIENTLYVKIDMFYEGMILPFATEMGKYEYGSIIVDLRNNPGGSVSGTVDIAGCFIDEGHVTESFYDGEKIVFEVAQSELYIDVPIVVLVNEQTASSAEILTALLKQYGEAKIVGVQTYGKGIFQQNKKIGDKYILHYTAGKTYVGEWDCFHEEGIKPDFEVKMDSILIGTEDDIQLNKALELLS